MKLFQFLKPKETLTNKEVDAGLRWLILDGMVSNGFNSITTSGLLAAFALALGANNLQIGILASIPFMLQIFQIPGIWLVEKLRHRKAIAVITFFFAQLLWIPIAVIPLFTQIPGSRAIFLLLVLATINGLLRAFTSSSWNSWIRDLVPQQILGRFFSRRLALASVVSIAFSLAAAFFIDYWSENMPAGSTIFGYTYVILFGAIFLAMASPIFMAFMPEPRMPDNYTAGFSFLQKLTTPLKDANFKKLMRFLFVWSVVSNLAIPFFTVYMLQRIGLPLSWVIALSILSQMLNILFLRIWGPLVDKSGNKVILSLCASLYLLVIFGWIFTTSSESYFLVIPALVILHAFFGIASAGITLTASTIGLKMAPQGEATTYLAGASLATNLGTGLGPLFGGLLADFFNARQLSLGISWSEPLNSIQFTVLNITGLDFLFLFSFLLGIPTLGLLAAIHEKGETNRDDVLESLMIQARELSRPNSFGIGFNLLNYFPVVNLKRVPLVGLDVALGVTIYQVAHVARLAALATIQSRNLIVKLARMIERFFISIWRYNNSNMESDGVVIAREAAYQALSEESGGKLNVELVENVVMMSVVKALSHAGAQPEDAILGASQGIIRAAEEAQLDLGVATYQIMKATEV
jgi:MFS family permease